ncbi:MAG TPA: cupin domain-containing protein [Candidatus Binatia bacterium]|nr:cupin domain-containing protein [Candidatus Binatia bacterium]
MAIVKINENSKLTDGQSVEQYLKPSGVHYEYWTPEHPVEANAPAAEILKAYEKEIDKLKAFGGYATADVIDVNAQTPGLDLMLAKFNREHWHDEDEVRFIIAGHGLFHIRPREGGVVPIEVEPGDLLLLPKGIWHWFDLCADRQIRAIRLFQNPSGWTPHYTESGVERNFEPICFGPWYMAPRA